jgi:DNA-binding MarR family transcriptional regulator
MKTLISDGHLNMKPHYEDKRKKILKLTAKGQKVVDTVNQYSNERLRTAFRPVSEKEIAKIVKGLELINEALRTARRSE